MTTEHLSLVKQSEVRTERAQRAVRAFRAMQPGLTGYARALTGKKNITVEVSNSSPMTDGKKIYMRPPITLGDMTPHKRELCEKRDPSTLQMLCKACRTREEVLTSIYHEVAHIAFGTFTKPSQSAIDRAVRESINEHGSKFAKSADAALGSRSSDHLNLSSIVSPYMPILVNALEDARVDTSMFRARRGTKVMFDAYIRSVFRGGIEGLDGTFTHWRDQPLNSQVLIGVFVLACKYDYEGWFHSDVESALADEELNELVRTIDDARTAEYTYNLAFPVLARLRELGFCRRPDDPEDDYDESEDSDEQDESTEPDDTDPEDSERTTESMEEEPPPQEGDSDDSGDSESDPSGSAESTDDASESKDSDDTEDSSGEGTGQGVGSESESEDEDSGDEEQGDSEGVGNEQETDSERDSSASESSGGDGEDQQEEEADSDASRDPAGESGADRGDSEEGDLESDDRDADESGEAEGEPVDTGADEGLGGTQVDTSPEYGTHEDAEKDLKVFSRHEESEFSNEDASDEEAVDVAIVQGEYFETPSREVKGVRVHRFDQHYYDRGYDVSFAWNRGNLKAEHKKMLGISGNFSVPEQVLGKALLEMRRVLADNARSSMERNLTSGRINQRVLGRRAWNKDERLFQKKRIPGKKSYAVVIGVDISGSTTGLNLLLAKRAAMAQAELCHRLGIKFAVYCHTANSSVHRNDTWLDMYEVKSFDELWSAKTKVALEEISSDAANLDGHSVEFYRRLVERTNATDKIILYYSDGKMPAENYREELEILQREIKTCKRRGIALMGVGIRTDSPRRHGLDTVQVNSDDDLTSVVRHLEKQLLRSR